MATIEDKYNPAELAGRLQKARRSTTEPIAFSAFDLTELEAVLRGVVRFDREIPDADKGEVIGSAVQNAAQSPTITAEILVRALTTSEQMYLRRRPQLHVVVFPVSLPHNFGRALRRWRRVRIILAPSLPPAFDRSNVQDRTSRFTAIDTRRHSYGRVSVHARTPAAAVQLGLEAADAVRGCWNFTLNRAALSRHSWPNRKPVNKVRFGPVYTVHNRSGTLATSTVWFDQPHYQHDRIENLASRRPRLEQAERWMRRRLAAISYGRDLEGLLVRYVRALDTLDYELAFSKLWSVLEHLTGTVGADYNTLIRRCAFLYSDRAYARQNLENLRGVRNGFIHHDRVPGAMEAYVFQLKRFVEDVLLFHLRQGGRFQALGSAAEFLQLSPKPAELRAKARLFRAAARFLER
jgi:hypothetical protein